MVKIINPFFQANPLAEAIKGFGQNMFGDTLTPALKRQQLRDSQREEFGTESLARIFGGASDGAIDPNAVSEMGILGGMKPEDAALWNVFLTGNKTGPRSSLTTNAMAGAGNYKNSAENLDLDRTNAFDMNAADNTQSGLNNAADNTRALTLGREGNELDWMKFFFEPEEALVDGKPGFATKGALAGSPSYGNLQLGQPVEPGATAPAYAPIPTSTEKTPVDQLVGFMEAYKVANPQSTPEQQRAWALQQIAKSRSKGITVSPDGTVQVGGDAGYDPTNTMTTGLQQESKSLDNFTSLLGEAKNIAQTDPTIFGAAGTIRKWGQGFVQAANNMSLLMGGKDLNEALTAAQAGLAANGFDASILSPKLDPALYEIESMANLLAYSAAEALAGQEGRSVSDMDVKYFQSIVGDPQALLMSQGAYISKLNFLERILARRIETNKKYSPPGTVPGAAQPAPPPTGSSDPPPTTAPAPAAPVASQKVINGKTYTQQNGQWFEVVP
jgi:hypothetical protein